MTTASAPRKIKFSVLIPALNEEAHIFRCIRSVYEHFPSSHSLEVFVGDHGSTDGTSAGAEAAGATVLHLPGGTVGELRNRLATHSSGEILIFLDADTEVTRSWGARIDEVGGDLFGNPLQITGSICVTPDREDAYIKYWFSKLPRKSAGYLGTGHLITSRSLFLALGGFNKNLFSGEDFDFCLRARTAGAVISIRPDMRVIHDDYPNSIRSFIRRERWHGKGDFQTVRAMLSSKVALVTLLFFALHAALLASIFYNTRLVFCLLASIVALLAALSFIKFKALNFNHRVANMAFYYLYLTGRTFSMFSRGGR